MGLDDALAEAEKKISDAAREADRERAEAEARTTANRVAVDAACRRYATLAAERELPPNARLNDSRGWLLVFEFPVVFVSEDGTWARVKIVTSVADYYYQTKTFSYLEGWINCLEVDHEEVPNAATLEACMVKSLLRTPRTN